YAGIVCGGLSISHLLSLLYFFLLVLVLVINYFQKFICTKNIFYYFIVNIKGD
ncbi:unnamed protein product, partial [marine sediment metagenome]